MERFNKKIILITLLIGIFLLTGCNKFSTFNNSGKDDSKAVTSVPTASAEKTSDNGKVDNSSNDKENKDTSPTKAAEPLDIYSVSEDGELAPVTALVPDGSEISAKFIVDKVVEALSDQSIDIGIQDVKTEKDSVIVSFEKDKAPYLATDSDEMESNILKAFAQSLIDNLDKYKKVFFRVEGKEYISDAFELPLDEPFMQE